MDLDLTKIQGITSKDEALIIPSLNYFLEKYKKIFVFPELDKHNLRKNLWNSIFEHINNTALSQIHLKCLSAVRILSRDKSNLNEIITREFLETLLICSGLSVAEVKQCVDYGKALEGLTSLCNIVFNSTVARAMCLKNGMMEGIMRRVSIYPEARVPYDVRLYDMRLLFLITGHCSEARPKLKDEMQGINHLTEILVAVVVETEAVITDSQVGLTCEVLKTLFNLTLKDENEHEDKTHHERLISVLQDLLLLQTQSKDRQLELQSNVVNLLAGLPTECLAQLSDVAPLHALLEFLRSRAECAETAPRGAWRQQQLVPVLAVLVKCARSSDGSRKVLRREVLPPLRDVHQRPEDGGALRNVLCRLLTSACTQLRQCAEELLFVLCKGNVARMVKYTGYGNAAGLFASRGLLSDAATAGHGSDSSDTDTEEYQEFRHAIDPVVGCCVPPQPHPTAHMTDEQKEHEAMQLVGLMDRLARTGVVQPCRVGEDGRPQPLRHVLQLQQNNAAETDSD